MRPPARGPAARHRRRPGSPVRAPARSAPRRPEGTRNRPGSARRHPAGAPPLPPLLSATGRSGPASLRSPAGPRSRSSRCPPCPAAAACTGASCRRPTRWMRPARTPAAHRPNSPRRCGEKSFPMKRIATPIPTVRIPAAASTIAGRRREASTSMCRTRTPRRRARRRSRLARVVPRSRTGGRRPGRWRPGGPPWSAAGARKKAGSRRTSTQKDTTRRRPTDTATCRIPAAAKSRKNSGTRTMRVVASDAAREGAMPRICLALRCSLTMMPVSRIVPIPTARPDRTYWSRLTPAADRPAAATRPVTGRSAARAAIRRRSLTNRGSTAVTTTMACSSAERIPRTSFSSDRPLSSRMSKARPSSSHRAASARRPRDRAMRFAVPELCTLITTASLPSTLLMLSLSRTPCSTDAISERAALPRRGTGPAAPPGPGSTRVGRSPMPSCGSRPS